MRDAYIRQIGPDDRQFVDEFLKRAGDSRLSFRYFEKRSLTVLDNHLVTAILFENDEPIGYAHLDKDEHNKIWLGIAVADQVKRRGFGKRLMQFLIGKIEEYQLDSVWLTVDKENVSAIMLYMQFGFSDRNEINDRSILMERKRVI